MEKYLAKHLVDTTPHDIKHLLRDTDFANCPNCKYENLKLKLSRANNVFVACDGFPNCRTTMSVPEGLMYVEKLKEG